MWMKLMFFLLIYISMPTKSKSLNAVKLINFQCISNESYLKETECYLKAQRRKSVLIYHRSFLYKTVEAGKLRVQVFRWYNGFRPYLVDFWSNFCELFTTKNNMNPVKTIFHNVIIKNSNLNHSCPYHGEILVPLVEPDLSMFPSLLATGRYRLTITFRESKTKAWLFTAHITGMVSSSLEE